MRGREGRLQGGGDRRRVDGVDLVQPHVHQLGVAVEGGELAERVRPGVDPGELVQPVPLELGLGPAQLALAWLLAQGEDVAPIPGTKKRSRLEENLGALDVTLTADDRARLDELAPVGATAGDRYPDMSSLGR